MQQTSELWLERKGLASPHARCPQCGANDMGAVPDRGPTSPWWRCLVCWYGWDNTGEELTDEKAARRMERL